jgi:hypothetical protein
VAASLKAAAARVPIRFMHGNRDFVAAAGFSAGTGALISRSHADRPLRHAHAAAARRHALHRRRGLPGVPRPGAQPAWQAAALARPIGERIAIAQDLR